MFSHKESDVAEVIHERQHDFTKEHRVHQEVNNIYNEIDMVIVHLLEFITFIIKFVVGLPKTVAKMENQIRIRLDGDKRQNRRSAREKRTTTRENGANDKEVY